MVKIFGVLSCLLVLSGVSLHAAEYSPEIRGILERETRQEHRTAIETTVQRLDRVYGNLYDRLDNGGKIIVYVDPAHGRLPSGKWQGEATWRNSSTDTPEEFYSVPLSRELYKLLANNPHIQVETTPDYLEVLKGGQIEYKDIWFAETVRQATELDAFMIISQHLNNLSPIYKADGRINIPGIQVTCNEYGTRYLSWVPASQSGFLTLYSKFDPTGLSFTLASEIKQNLVAKGLTANNWDFGSVADDRFTYFNDFPVSLIYESAFICNPQEERMLRDPLYQQMFAQAHYQAIINGIAKTFGVDISGRNPRKVFDQSPDLTNILILGRIAIYYMRAGDPQKAIDTIWVMTQRYEKSGYAAYIKPYQDIYPQLVKVRDYLRLADVVRSRRQYGVAITYYRYALNTIGYIPVFGGIRYDIYKKYNEIAAYARVAPIVTHPIRSEALEFDLCPPRLAPLPVQREQHTLAVPFILTIEPGDTLEQAVMRSLAPREEIREKVLAKFRQPTLYKISWVKVWSAAQRRFVWIKRENRIPLTFIPGIYTIKLDSAWNIIAVQREAMVVFSPSRYQSQLFFKNSCLADPVREREL